MVTSHHNARKKGVVALAEALGLEVILGAFAAGVILRFIDQDQLMTHPQFRQKLEGVGYGVFIPVFVTIQDGMRRRSG